MNMKLVASKPLSFRPNNAFMAQLELFHQVSYRVSKRDKATRSYYLERTIQEVLSQLQHPVYVNLN